MREKTSSKLRGSSARVVHQMAKVRKTDAIRVIGGKKNSWFNHGVNSQVKFMQSCNRIRVNLGVRERNLLQTDSITLKPYTPANHGKAINNSRV